MISNHSGFIKAITDRTKICVRFFSHPDDGVVDLVCAPVDYGVDTNSMDDAHRYQVWDFSAKPGKQSLTLVPRQITDLRVLGEKFDPSPIPVPATSWSVPRNWSSAASTAPRTSSLAAPAAVAATGIPAPSRMTTPAPALVETSSP